MWDAGIVLARYVATLPRPGEQCVFVELGAGTGHVGLTACASCPEGDGRLAALVLTDLPAVVPLLEENCARNVRALPSALRIAVLPFRWGDTADFSRLSERARARDGTPAPRTLCIGGDLLYRHEVVEPLVCALRALLLPAATAGVARAAAAAHDARALSDEALLSASMEHCPDAVSRFVCEASAAGLRVSQVHFDELDRVYRARSVVVLRVTARGAPRIKAPQ